MLVEFSNAETTDIDSYSGEKVFMHHNCFIIIIIWDDIMLSLYFTFIFSSKD